MIIPPNLSKGDLIYITAPAKATDAASVSYTKSFLESHGFRVLLSKHCLGVHRYFSGTDEERTSDMQFGIDHPEVKAILCARGGYGCVRIVDEINWANMLREPRWIIGFSDVTVLHSQLNLLNLILFQLNPQYVQLMPEHFGNPIRFLKLPSLVQRN